MAPPLQKEEEELHFVLVPLMGPGHFIPILDMALLLAQRGLLTTIITTPRIASRFTPTVHRAVHSGHRLRLLPVHFPSLEVGLPEGCESTENIDSLEALSKFMFAIGKWQEPFDKSFQDIQPRPSCIIADKHITWLVDTSRKFNVPRIIFDGMSCFTLMCNHSLQVSKPHHQQDETEPFVLPGLPHRIKLTKAQLPIWFDPSSSEGWKEVAYSESQAHGMVVNSFEELEPEYLVEYKKVVKGGRVWSIGPLSLYNKTKLDQAQRGGERASVGGDKCLEWLDQREPGSVVYACLGSIPRLTLPQMIELGLGLEASGHPFIWVVRGSEKLCEEIEEWIAKDGYEERTQGRGLVIRGWAPQVLILSHQSLGAFLTHCGWNSTLEGVCAGVPMITWPLFSDQFFDEKFVVDVLEIGVSAGNKFAVHFCAEDKRGVVVKRGMVAEAVEKAMDGGSEGEERRRKAKVLGKMADKAMEEGGSSFLNMTLMIEHVLQLISPTKC